MPNSTDADSKSFPHYEFIEVLPGALEKLELGTFDNGKKVPEYQFDFIPDLPDVMGVHFSETKTKAGVQVICHLQNYSSQPITVYPRKKII